MSALAEPESPVPAHRGRHSSESSSRGLFWAGIVALALGAVAGAFLGWRTLVGLQYAQVYSAHQQVSQAREPAVQELDTAIRAATSLHDRVAPVLVHPRAATLTREVRELADRDAALSSVLSGAAPAPVADPRPVAPPPAVTERPWPWDVGWDALRLARATGDLRTVVEQDSATAQALRELTEPVATADAALFAEVAATAEQVLAETPSATNRSRLTLQDEIGTARSPMTSRHTAQLLDRLATAESGVRESHAQKEAQKADPGYAVRLRVEEYARSIANGVPIDFEWASVVAGVGSRFLSGTAQWDATGRWTLITLNVTIERAWAGFDAFDAKALVTHEVGHVQVIRPECAPIFANPAFDGDHEKWATAWAIGMGFDTPGAGIEAYGRPTSEQIALASGCR